MMMVQRSRNSLLVAAFCVSVVAPVFLGTTNIGDGCKLVDRQNCDRCEAVPLEQHLTNDACKQCVSSGCDEHRADKFDAVTLAICWAVALILVVVYVCTMTTTLIFGTAPSSGMGTDGTVHIHLTGPDAADDGDRIMKQIHHRRGSVMRSQRR